MIARTSLSVVILLATFASAPFAQTEGPLAGTPAVVLVEDGTTGPGGMLASDTMHRKSAGFGAYAPNGPSFGITDPLFTMDAMFGGGLPVPFEINAYSIGLDCLLATPPVGGKSFTMVPPTAWGAILFSVTPGTSGESGSLIEAQASASDGAAADFFTLMIPGSNLPPSVTPCYPQDRPQLALDSADMGLFVPFAPGNVTAVDIYTPLYHAGPPITGLLPAAPTVYFSVSKDAIVPPMGPSLVPTFWFAGSAPSSATILKTTWSPTMGMWSAPTVHIPYFDLGLDVCDDIDALAVDEAKCLLMFSIVATPGTTIDDQLTIASWPKPDAPADAGVSTGTYVTSESGGTETVASRARAGSDGDIDGTCVIDPQGNEQTGGGPATTFIYGSPVFPATPEKVLGAGLYRDEAMGGPTLTPVVHGVPIGPTSPRQRLELWPAFQPPLGPYVVIPPIYIEPLDGTIPLPYRELPLVIPPFGALIGATIDFFWVVRGQFPRPSSVVLRIAI